MKCSAIVEACHAHTILAKTLKIEIGGDALGARGEALGLGEMLAILVDQALAVPSKIGGALLALLVEQTDAFANRRLDQAAHASRPGLSLLGSWSRRRADQSNGWLDEFRAKDRSPRRGVRGLLVSSPGLVMGGWHHHRSDSARARCGLDLNQSGWKVAGGGR